MKDAQINILLDPKLKRRLDAALAQRHELQSVAIKRLILSYILETETATPYHTTATSCPLAAAFAETFFRAQELRLQPLATSHSEPACHLPPRPKNQSRARAEEEALKTSRVSRPVSVKSEAKPRPREKVNRAVELATLWPQTMERCRQTFWSDAALETPDESGHAPADYLIKIMGTLRRDADRRFGTDRVTYKTLDNLAARIITNCHNHRDKIQGGVLQYVGAALRRAVTEHADLINPKGTA